MKTRAISTVTWAITLAMLFIASYVLTQIASAEDRILETSIDSATIALDKNGAEYVRFIVTEPRQLNGVSYQKSLPVMAFGDQVPAAKTMAAGDALKAVANYRKLPDGRESYTVISFIE